LQFQENGIFIEFIRQKQPKLTKAFLPILPQLNPIDFFKLHLQEIPQLKNNDRLWWQWNMKFQHFDSQHLGKRIIAKIVKEIAKFHLLSSDKFGAYSFRRLGATNLAEGGATP
jgi:hypothetical protein